LQEAPITLGSGLSVILGKSDEIARGYAQVTCRSRQIISKL